MSRIPISKDEIPKAFQRHTGSIQRLAYPTQGDTSDVAFVDAEGGQFAIKRARELPFREWLAWECQVLQALQPHALPAPRPYAFVEQPGKAMPESWLLMERLPGEPVCAALQATPDPITRRILLNAFGQALKQIHAIKRLTANHGTTPAVAPHPACAKRLHGGWTENQQSWLDTMLERATEYMTRYEVDGSPALLEWLRREQPEPFEPALIHGDFTLENTLVDNGRISGIIDWAGGAIGDPRYDLALATEPKPEAFQSADDLDAFYAGYGGPRLTEQEHAYFIGLYEFF